MVSVTFFAALLAAAQNGPPAWTISSEIESVYEDFNGTPRQALVRLDNGSGTYGAQGHLLNLIYFPLVNHPRGDSSPALVGEWRLGSQRGYFVFREPQNDQIDGYWGTFD